MSDRLVDIEFVNGQTKRETFVSEDGDVTIKTVFNPNPALDEAKLLRNDAPVNKAAPGRLVALLPLEVIEHWRLTKGINWFTATEKEKADLLNDPDNALFRTGGGRI